MAQQSATIQVQYVPDWPEQGVDRLLVAWDRPRIRALVEAIGEGVQLQEDQTFDLLTGTTLEASGGDSLDQWGELVGEQRLGLSDNDYRQFIMARMLVNRSNGTIDALIEILEVAAAPVVAVYHQSNFPAGLYLIVVRNAPMSDAVLRRVARLLEDARPGGRHLTAIEALNGSFAFAGNPDGAGFDVGPFARLIH